MKKADSLKKNVFYLTILQAFNYLIPLLLIPYLIATIGDYNYGVIIISQSMMVYFYIFIDYGFTLSAIKNIANNSDNKNKITEIYSSVLFIKIILAVVSVFILYIMGIIFNEINKHILVYYLAFGVAIGKSFSLDWYFQGKENMQSIAIINILSRSVFFIMIFFIVNNEKDYLYVPFLMSCGYVFSAILGFIYLKKVYKQEFIIQKKYIIIKYLTENFHFFISRISSIGYTQINILLIGFTLSYQFAAYYYLADKVIAVILSIFYPIQTAIYPNLSKKFDKTLYLKIAGGMLWIAIISTIILVLYKDAISVLLIGREVGIFMDIVSILSLLLPISVIYIMLGAPLLLAKGFSKQFNNSIIYGFFIHLLLLLGVYFYAAESSKTESEILIYISISLVISKLFVLGLRVLYTINLNLLQGILK